MIPHIQTTDIQQQTSQHPSLCFVTSPLFGFSSLSILALSLYYYFSSISISSLTFFFSSFSFFVLSISSFSSISSHLPLQNGLSAEAVAAASDRIEVYQLLSGRHTKELSLPLATRISQVWRRGGVYT